MEGVEGWEGISNYMCCRERANGATREHSERSEVERAKYLLSKRN